MPQGIITLCHRELSNITSQGLLYIAANYHILHHRDYHTSQRIITYYITGIIIHHTIHSELSHITSQATTHYQIRYLSITIPITTDYYIGFYRLPPPPPPPLLRPPTTDYCIHHHRIPRRLSPVTTAAHETAPSGGRRLLLFVGCLMYQKLSSCVLI